MNEKVLIEQLQRDVDHLLDGHALPESVEPDNEYHELVETARLLAHHDMSNESRIRKVLRKELLVRISDERKDWSSKKTGTALVKTPLKLLTYIGAVVIILFVTAALPPVQAVAREILKKVGPFVVITEKLPPTPQAVFPPTPIARQPIEATDSTQSPGYASNTPTLVPPDPNVRAMTPEEAFAQFNFRVLIPAYIPDGLTIVNAPDFVFAGPDYINSDMVYAAANDAYLSIGQSTFDPREKIPFYVGDVDVTQLEVRGRDAIFVKDAITGVLVDANGKDIPVSYLMWEEDDLFFMIQTTTLTQAEVVKVAESMQ